MSRQKRSTIRVNGSSHGPSTQDKHDRSHEERLEWSRRQPDAPPPPPKINWDRASRDPNLAEALRRGGPSDDSPRRSRYDGR